MTGPVFDGACDTTLNRAAYRLGRLVGAGLLRRRTAAATLLAAALRCGLGEAEAARTIRSGLEAGELFGSREDDPNSFSSPKRISYLGRPVPTIGAWGVHEGRGSQPLAPPRSAAASPRRCGPAGAPVRPLHPAGA